MTVLAYQFTASPLAAHPDFGKWAFFECQAYFETEHSAHAFAQLMVLLEHEKLGLHRRVNDARLQFPTYAESHLPTPVVHGLKARQYFLATRPLSISEAQN